MNVTRLLRIIAVQTAAFLALDHTYLLCQELPQAAVSVMGISRTGDSSSSTLELTIEEILVTQTFPLLPYVFFNSGSASLDTRYEQLGPEDAKSFQPKDLLGKLARKDTLGLYRSILNIVGRRMVEKPSATITLTGCTERESGGKNLAQQRAETVRDYLSGVWNVSPQRITIKTANRPKKSSPELGDGDGIQENRRLEIVSADPSILAPLIMYDTLRSATPPIIRFNLAAKVPAGFKEYHLEATQRGEQLFKSASAVRLIPTIEWDVEADKSKMPRFEDSITYRLEVTDNNGKKGVASGSFLVDQLTIRKKRLERRAGAAYDVYRMILFDFGSARLERPHMAILDTLVRFIGSDSVIALDIVGYSDRMGPAGFNRELATRRARAVERAIAGRKLKRSDSIQWRVQGIGEGGGESELLRYNNETPEGRFYSRTVEIWVERKVFYLSTQ